MENRRFVIAVLSVCMTVPQGVHAYAAPTHDSLTNIVVEQYHAQRGDAFTGSEITALVQGSRDEDSSWRFLNHFYDGVTGKGIDGNLPATAWAVDILEQANWYSLNLSQRKPLFSGKGDHSWQRAIYEYVHGDSARGAEALGHILHLVQDMTVPAHVRSDRHPQVFGIGDKDDYEYFTRDMSRESVVIAGVPMQFENIEQAIRNTAKYTQENFLSSDTLFENYSLPSRASLDLERSIHDGENQYFGNMSFGKIVRIYRNRDTDRNSETVDTIVEEYFISDKQNKILKENWEQLSAHAVRASIGVIDLFFKEVEKERATGRLLAMNKSYNETEQAMKRLASARDSKLSLTSLAAADVYELNKEEMDGYFAAAEIYGIHVPAVARESALKDEATALVAFEQAVEALTNKPPQPKPEPDLFGLIEKLNQAAALLAALQAQLLEREKECVKNSLQGPWNKIGWIGDKPGCDDPTPGVQKMFFAPIQGVGGASTGTLTGTLALGATLINPGATTTATWSTEGASACTVTGTNGDSWNGTSGSETTSAIIGETIYTLSCTGSGTTLNVEANVNVVPLFQEF